MKSNISKVRIIKILEWILFIVFIFESVWFVSGVLQHFFSRKTSFTQHKEKVTDYPVHICHRSNLANFLFPKLLKTVLSSPE